jgi:hypothetical protein
VRMLFLVMIAAVLSSCSASNSSDADAGSDPVDLGRLFDGGEVACLSDCSNRVCGDDGCGGVCGECLEGLSCSDLGQCQGPGCETDDDCGEGLSCHPGLDSCVECIVHSDCGGTRRCVLGSCMEPVDCTSDDQCPAQEVCDLKTKRCGQCVSGADCPTGSFCGGDAMCHATNPCSGDASCSDGQVCDKSKGLCVNCLTEASCPEWEYCYKGACVTDDCFSGTSFCQQDQIVVCKEGGKGFVVAETCTADQFCLDAACVDRICVPESAWCEDNVMFVCDAQGGALAAEVDCAASGLNCVGGECTDLACVPGASFCSGDFTAAQCAEDGQGFSEAPCEPSHYCDEGACLPQVCLPGQPLCNGLTAEQCDNLGRKLKKTDCGAAGQGCVGGQCVDYACEGGKPFCLDATTPAICAADGYSYQESSCPEGNYCDAGFCFLYVCEPASLFCVDQVTHSCAEDGSTSQALVDCAPKGQFCWKGECVACLPACDGMECGDDGCGGLCGTCLGNQESCQDGQCLCTPACTGKECGPDGCTGTCGECTGPQQMCIDGQCQCQPACDGMECGDDGCGGSCGQCNPGQFCIAGQCPPEGKACDDGNATPWDGCQGNSLAEFLLAGAASAQQSVRLAAHKDGGYVATWVAEVGGLNLVRIRRFLATGTPLAPDVSAHSAAAGQGLPAIATLANGASVVAWDGYQIDNSSKGVQARLFDAGLVPVTSAFTVNTTTAGDQDTAAVVALAGGSFAIAWESGGDQDGSSTGIFARGYDAQGVAVTGEFQVNTFTYAAQYGPALAPLGTGFVATWNSVLQDGASGGIYGQRFDNNFEPVGAEFLVNEVTANNQRDPVAATWTNGVYVAWESNNQDGSNWGLFMRGFGNQGAPVGGDTAVNVTTEGEQRLSALGCTATGACTAGWRHALANGAYDVRFRSFGLDGQGGDETIASVASLVTVERPSVVRLVNGDIVVAWTGDGYGTGTRAVARRYQADGTPVYH